MPMTEKRYVQIKANLDMWQIIDPEHTDQPALVDMFREMRNAFVEIVAAQDEANPPSLWRRIKGAFGG